MGNKSNEQLATTTTKMNADVVVPNQPPVVDPGSVRLAITAEAPSVEEVSWTLCVQGHGFALEHWFHKQLVQRDRCPVCGNRDFTPKPTPMVGESGRLLNELLRDAGLPRERCFIGNCSRIPLHEAEKTLAHCRNGLARLAVDLEAFEPTCVLVLGNLALAAFTEEGRSVTAWRGSILTGQLAGVDYKVCVAVHPASVLREPSQLALLRFDVKRAVGEAATPELKLPVRSFWHPKGDVLICEPVR